MITGDGDLVEILATVRYHVTDPRQFLFGVRRPRRGRPLRGRVGAARTGRRAGVPRTAHGPPGRARTRCARPARAAARGTRRGGLGVALDGFTLHDLHPPPEVVSSYHAVAKAIQERDRVINEAEADALRTRRRAEEEADRVLKRADADAHATREAAAADRDAFLAWHAVRNKLAGGGGDARNGARRARGRRSRRPWRRNCPSLASARLPSGGS